jgi:hypothetical protein
MVIIRFSLPSKITKCGFMIRIFLTVGLLLLSITAMAQTTHPIQAEPSDFRWENRIVIIFSDSETDSLYREQLSNIEGSEDGFLERDIITFHIFRDGNSRLGTEILHNATVRTIRKKFAEDNPDFRLLLLGKDGGVKLQKKTPF